MTKTIKKDLMKNSKGELAEKLIFAYHSLEKAEKTLTEAKKEGVRKFLEKVKLTCFSRYSRMIKPSCKTCDYNFICNQTPKNWNDEVIKKVEGI